MEIVEVSVGSLQFLAKDDMNRNIIRQNADLIPIFDVAGINTLHLLYG